MTIPIDVYTQMMDELQTEMDALERQVFLQLKQHPHGLTRPQLIALVFRTTPADNLSNSTKDRKIRKAIQSLREKSLPVFSNSGRAGYRLGGSEADKQAMLADLRRRRDVLTQRIAQVERTPIRPTA